MYIYLFIYFFPFFICIFFSFFCFFSFFFISIYLFILFICLFFLMLLFANWICNRIFILMGVVFLTWRGNNRLRISTVAIGFLSPSGIGWDGLVSFKFYIFLCTSNSISKGSCDICYRKDINIFTVVFPKIHSCFSVSSGHMD